MKELIRIGKEYVMGLQMEVNIKKFKVDVVRQQELAAYFTYCNL